MTEQNTAQIQQIQVWPRLRLRLPDWSDTKDTLHMWTQIVGKIRMAHAPMVNHWWHVTLYVSPRGLTTSTIPYRLDHPLPQRGFRHRVRLPRPPATYPYQRRPPPAGGAGA